MVGERILGLPRQLDPVDEEQDAGDDTRLEQSLDEGRRCSCTNDQNYLTHAVSNIFANGCVLLAAFTIFATVPRDI